MRWLVWATLMAACGGKAPTVTAAAAPERSSDARSAGVRSPALAALLEEHWDATMERHPVWATSLGDHRFAALTFDPSVAAEQQWRARQRAWIERLNGLSDLDGADRRTRDLLAERLQHDVASEVCRFGDWSFSPRDNPLLDVNWLAELAPMERPRDATDLAMRLGATAGAIDERGARLEFGLAAGLVANRTSTALVIEQLRAQLAEPLDSWPMLRALERAPASWTEAQRAEAETSLRAAAERVTEALGRWVDRVERDVLPVARDDAEGLAGLPIAADCYGALIRQHTTLALDADAIHQIGLDAIAAIHAETRILGERALGTADLPAIFTHLRTEPSLYFETEQQVEDKAVEALARAQAAVPDWFGRLPESPCVVERVPPYEAPYTTIAYYRQAVPGERPGAYFVNTYQPETRPRHEAEALAFHESVPGHHLQIALAREAGDLPLFQRHLAATAYVEGWGLYAERLADEMGLYSGDLDRLGMLSFDLWRAARLVVDTGLHSKAWTREQAVQFMLENTPLAENNIRNEVDRYVTTPGQALAYKLGQRHLLELRATAEQRLGDRFDVRAFHDAVLGAGPVSLPVLTEHIDAWVERTAQGG